MATHGKIAVFQKLTYSGVVLFLAFAVFTAEPSFEIKPGHLKDIPYICAPERTIDLFIPSAYMKETERKFPVLFMSSPGGFPRVDSQREWAERHAGQWGFENLPPKLILIAYNNGDNDPNADWIARAITKPKRKETRGSSWHQLDVSATLVKIVSFISEKFPLDSPCCLHDYLPS